jgi:hypothetical protein
VAPVTAPSSTKMTFLLEISYVLSLEFRYEDLRRFISSSCLIFSFSRYSLSISKSLISSSFRNTDSLSYSIIAPIAISWLWGAVSFLGMTILNSQL